MVPEPAPAPGYTGEGCTGEGRWHTTALRRGGLVGGYLLLLSDLFIIIIIYYYYYYILTIITIVFNKLTFMKSKL